MTFKRSKFEILLNILFTIYRGSHKRTHIMYKANLSWNRLNEYLNFLIKQGLIEELPSEKSKEYYLTDRGKNVVWYFLKIKEAIKVESLSP